MKLNAPRFVTWIISIILVAIALLIRFDVVDIKNAGDTSWWLAIIGYAVLCFGTLLRGL